MTQTELDALPEIDTSFGQELRVIDGKPVRVAIPPKLVVLWDVLHVTDHVGTWWAVGWYKGTRYKQKHLSQMTLG